MAIVQKAAIWQRMRVAILGLTIVSATIFGANAIVDQAIDDPDLADVNLQQDIAETGTVDGVEETPNEPLAELGVTPVPKDDSDAQPTEVAEPGANPVAEDDNNGFVTDEETDQE